MLGLPPLTGSKFFLRTPDADVERYLKLFTFMPIDQIQSIMAEHHSEPNKRIAQHQLAFEVLELTHGKELATQAAQQHDLVFKSIPPGAANPAHIPETTPLDIGSPHTTQNNAPSPHALLPASLVYNQPLSRVLYYAGLVKSRGEGHRIVANKGAYVGSRPGRSGPMGDHLEFTPVQNWEGGETEKFITDGDMLILRVGKWKVKIIKIVSDEQFKQLGLTAPGWNEVDKEPSRVTSKTPAKKRHIFSGPPGKWLEPFAVSDEEWHALAPAHQEWLAEKWLAAAEEQFTDEQPDEKWLGPPDEK
jgi:tyrosyl-tRNA synthetase